jgi:hypothetical protein
MNQAFDIARSMIGMAETGHNSGEVVERVMGEDMVGQPWCAGFVTYCFTAGGQDAWMEGLSNRFAVDTIMQHGRDKKLNSNLSEGALPKIGSLVEFTEWPHIGMISRVEEENGETVYYVTDGNNSSGEVRETPYPASEFKEIFKDNFVDSTKIDAYHASLNQNITPLVRNSVQQTQQIQQAANTYQQLPTPQQVQNTLQQNNGNATQTYDHMLTSVPQLFGSNGQQNGLMSSFLMPLMAVMVLAAVGEQGIVPAHNNYQQNPNIGRERIEQYDQNRANGHSTSGIASQDISNGEALNAVPPTTPSNVAQNTARIVN